MLYVIVKGKTVATWHTGEPLPLIPPARVVTFQADGDELDFLVWALNFTKPPTMAIGRRG